MPSYDALCSQCGYEGIVVMRIANLSDWDMNAICPRCHHGEGAFHRVIKQAVWVATGGSSLPKKAGSSSVNDESKHRQWQKEDKAQIAEAHDIVKHGKYEGF
ncbi:MAG: zinc ribbon domain-containing protein [Oligoflexales bacterium]|nr:zinc ribbon domain-containing protein [Oligoflexales bacterium]